MLMGQQLGGYGPSAHGNHWDTMLAVVRAGEQAGLDSVWLADHFMFPDREHPEKEVPIFDCFVALGAIAACTSRVRIGQLVVGVPYRNPALLAKMLSTLDVIAHGRTIIGLGAAWHDEEFHAYGWPFPSVRERMERLEEAVQIVGQAGAVAGGDVGAHVAQLAHAGDHGADGGVAQDEAQRHLGQGHVFRYQRP